MLKFLLEVDLAHLYDRYKTTVSQKDAKLTLKPSI
jgi:hypothetical protein